MRLLAFLPLLLVACSGGGGSAEFAPSANIAATHPWLAGQWLGELRRDGLIAGQVGMQGGAGNGSLLSVYLGAAMIGSGEAIGGNGTMEASGSELRATTESPEGGRMTFVGTAFGVSVIEGEWRVSKPGSPVDGWGGTLRLTKQASAVLLERYDSGDLTIIVRTER
jgi:hypothetical protein